MGDNWRSYSDAPGLNPNDMVGLSGLACNDDRCTVIVSDQADGTGYEPVISFVGRSSWLATKVAGLLGCSSAQLHRPQFPAAAVTFLLQHRHIIVARTNKAQNDADVVEWVPWDWDSVCPVCRLPLRSDAKVCERVFAFRADRLIQTDDNCKRGRGRFEYLAVICAPPLQSRAAKPDQPRSLDNFSQHFHRRDPFRTIQS